MDGRAWWAAVHGVAKSRTWLSDFTFTLHFHALEKEMATHYTVLAWRIPETGEPGGLWSLGSHRVGHDWRDLAAAAAPLLKPESCVILEPFSITPHTESVTEFYRLSFLNLSGSCPLSPLPLSPSELRSPPFLLWISTKASQLASQPSGPGLWVFAHADSPWTSLPFSSVAQLCSALATPWTAAHQASLSTTNSQSFLKLMPMGSLMSSNHLILCRPLLLLPSIFPSIRVFSNESVLCIRWPKYWSFSFSISPSNDAIQDWFPLGWTGLISLLSKWLSRVFSSTTVRKHQFFSTQLSSWQIDGEKEKTLVSPLDSKEIKPVNLKGNQP